jgi:hypothetical protein
MQHPNILLQHPDENTYNIRLIQMKHLEHTLETYVHNHCNICNISIYFCYTDTKQNYNVSLKHLKTPETYVCNMPFQHDISLLLGNRGSLVCGVHRCRARYSGGEGHDRSGVICHRFGGGRRPHAGEGHGIQEVWQRWRKAGSHSMLEV